MLTGIVGGELYAPEPLGRGDVLFAAGKVIQTGSVDVDGIRRSGLPVDVIDASGHVVVPGLIDPHQHLIGGSGEKGWASQTPEISWGELVRAGITTVVGCLGADTITRTMETLIARVRALRGQHIEALAWSGGYDVPPATLTGSVQRDMLLVGEIIGCGELAISDARSSSPGFDELLRLVKHTHTAGTLTGKSGVVHFHLGDEPERLSIIRRLLTEGHADPESLYPTHVSRNEPLLAEAATLSRQGVTVDMDTVDLDLAERLRFFLERGGDPEHLTVSSDAAISSPSNLFDEIRRCIHEHVVELPAALRLVTVNTARVLRLQRKGRIEPGCDADILVLSKPDLTLRDVVSGGVIVMSGGSLTLSEPWTEESNRRVELNGRKH